jgi:hypothetical protein
MHYCPSALVDLSTTGKARPCLQSCIAQASADSGKYEAQEAGFKLASDLANAKDVQGVLAIQSRFAQTQVMSYGRATTMCSNSVTAGRLATRLALASPGHSTQ